MQLFTVLCGVLATAAIGTSASPIRQNQHVAAKHPPQVLENNGSAQAPHEEFHPVSPLPKVASPRSDRDAEFSMSGNIDRRFDTISPPPKVLPPCSDDGDFSMSGLLLPPKIALSNDGKLPTVHARKDGFLAVLPPPKIAADDAAISARNTTIDHFDVISPPPKTRPSETKLDRRANIWTSGFIGNVINKWTGKSPTTPTSSGSGSGSGGLTPLPTEMVPPNMELPRWRLCQSTTVVAARLLGVASQQQTPILTSRAR